MAKKVLIIEDDEAITETLKILLESRGFETETAEDGDTGMEIISRTKPDMIVLDLYLPGKSGLDIYLEIRDDADLANAPVIFLSSLTKSQMINTLGESAEIIPDNSIFSKPIDPNQLIGRIEEELAGAGIE